MKDCAMLSDNTSCYNLPDSMRGDFGEFHWLSWEEEARAAFAITFMDGPSFSLISRDDVSIGRFGIHLGFSNSPMAMRCSPMSLPLPMTNTPHSMKIQKYACISLTVCTSSPKVQIANRQYRRMLHHTAQFMAMAASSCSLRRKHETQKITRMCFSAKSEVGPASRDR